jgi:vancomycin permeability regulator SanA
LIFGAGVIGSRPSKELQSRLDVALRVWEQSNYSLIFLSGGIKLGVSEPEVMLTYLKFRGIPETNLRVLDSSFNTRETINSFKEITGDLSNNATIAISSPYHSLRIILEGKRKKLNFIVVGDKESPEQNHSHVLRIRSITEVLAITFYLLPHRFTKHVSTNHTGLRHKIPKKLIELGTKFLVPLPKIEFIPE